MWNLVFIQYQRFPDGHLESLPAKHVDTGMGLERICRVIQGVDSNYSTDLFIPILNRISDVTKKADTGEKEGVAFRVLADHIRSLGFAIADGAFPSNEGRGYVLRRMLRRATRYGRVLNMNEPFIYKLVPVLVEVMGKAFPEIKKQQEHVENVIKAEETSFGKTLDRGLDIFEKMISNHETNSQKNLSGENVFKLYDTFGFPPDLTRLLCEERGIGMDESEFEELMQQQQKRARETRKFKVTLNKWIEVSPGPDSEFLGYELFSTESNLRRYSFENDAQLKIILDKTPFYAESGGQASDLGTLEQNGNKWRVVDVQKQGDSIVHFCNVFDVEDKDKLLDNSLVYASIDESARLKTTNNHTAAHLMHEALKQVLGEHVNQAGSLVNSEMLRFDFTHFEKVKNTQLDEIENIVNAVIRENISTYIYETPFKNAIDSGITALFGEKYGDVVRVVKISDFSEELCGGCHVKSTGQIGQFRLQSEEAISSGVRRIVAITGLKAESMNQEHSRVVRSLRQLMNVPDYQVPEMVKKLAEEKKILERELKELRSQKFIGNISDLIKEAEDVNGVLVLTKLLEVDSSDTLRKIGIELQKEMNSGVAWLVASISGKFTMLCMVTNDLVLRGFKAGELVNEIAKLAGGKGGGKDDMAQAGLKNLENINEAFSYAVKFIRKKMNN